MKKDSGWFWHHVVSTAFAFGIVAIYALLAFNLKIFNLVVVVPSHTHGVQQRGHHEIRLLFLKPGMQRSLLLAPREKQEQGQRQTSSEFHFRSFQGWLFDIRRSATDNRQ